MVHTPIVYVQSEPAAHLRPTPVEARDLISAARAAGCPARRLLLATVSSEEILRNHFDSIVSDSLYDIKLDAAAAARVVLLDGASDAVREALAKVDAQYQAKEDAYEASRPEPTIDPNFRDPFEAVA